MEEQKNKISPIKVASLIFSISVLCLAIVSLSSAAWQTPTAAPPGNNVWAPLNVGNSGQSKVAGLVINCGASSTCNDPLTAGDNGLLVPNGKVGIGTTSPNAKLEINGGGGEVLRISGGAEQLSFTPNGRGYNITEDTGGTYTPFLNIKNSYSAGIGMQLYVQGNVGIGTTSPSSKLSIRENGANTLQFPLRLTNPEGTDAGGTATGILFETEVNNFGKGALVYERKDSYGRGSFHFLQNTGANTDYPILANTVLTITNSGNVGIGTATPGNFKLNVNGDIGLTGGKTLAFRQDLGNGAYAIQYKDDAAGLGHYPIRFISSDDPGTNRFFEFGYYTDDSQAKTWNPKVLINSYTGNLEIAGQIKISGGSPGTNKVLTSDANGLATWQPSTSLWTDQGTYIYPNNDASFVIKDDGNVGIGTTTPGRELSIYSNSGAQINLTGTTNGAWEGVEYKSPSYQGYSGMFDSDGHFFIDTGSNGEDLTILQNGNVGIGTTTPAAILNVVQSAAWNGSNYALLVSGYSNLGGLRLNGADGQRALYGITSGSEMGFGTNAGDISFSTDASGATRKVVIKATNGYVGIGTTTPAQQLTVTGTVGLNGTVYVGDNSNQKMYFDGGFDAYIQGSGVGHGNSIQMWTGNGAAKATLDVSQGLVKIRGTENPIIMLQPNSNTGDSPMIRASGNDLQFGTYAGTTVNMVVKADNNVGIGTTSPMDGLATNYYHHSLEVDGATWAKGGLILPTSGPSQPKTGDMWIEP